MNLPLIIAAVLWVLGSSLSLGNPHALFACGDEETETSAPHATGHHGEMAMAHMGHGGPHDCEDECCGGACLCKASCGALTAMPSDASVTSPLDAIASHNALPADLIREALHLMADPPPRFLS